MNGQTDIEFPAGSKAFVTGATGFVGSVLVRKLLESGVEVRALARPTSDLKAFKELPIEWVVGDVCDRAAIRKGVEGVNYIFQLATSFRDGGAVDEVHRKVHVEATKILAEAALKEHDFRRYVHVSTIGVHGHIEHPPANETYPFHPGDPYQDTKLEGELWIRGFARRNGLPLTVIRPATVYGPGDRRMFKLFKMAFTGWFPIVGYSKGYLHLIHVEDLTDCMILQALHPNAVGEVFICAGPKVSTLKEIVRQIGEAYGVSVKFIHLPAQPVFWTAGILEKVCHAVGITPPVYPRRVSFFTKDRSFSIEKAKTCIGFSPRYTDEYGFRELAHWYVDNGWLKAGNGFLKKSNYLRQCEAMYQPLPK